MRIKSSFIYLANAVNDLRSNWQTLALVLAPTALLAALCLLPDALNLQHDLAQHLAPGTHNVMMHLVGWRRAQESYPPAAPDAPLFSDTQIMIASASALLLTLAANLLVLCTLKQAQENGRVRPGVTDTAAIFRMAFWLAPAYAWVALLQYALPMTGFFVMQVHLTVSSAALMIILNFIEVLLLALGALLYLWVFFARYALIFDGKHSFHALLYSRDLIRKRFFRVAARIVVFLAVWWGYHSAAALVFTLIGLVVGPVAVLTGSVWLMIFPLDLVAVFVSFATTAFFIAAGVRLYLDLRTDFAASQPVHAAPGLGATARLAEVSSPAAS
ncbi:MAG TPA: hypothetical protein VMF50_17590 [Candidatus Binataceae bacterium]|nr:hypothetical protein [Candidatus Binataceae bacterium]